MHSDSDSAALPDDRGVPAPANDLGPLSPELALVDPGLARAARALLPEPAPVARPRVVATPAPPAVPPTPAAPAPAPSVPELVPEPSGPGAQAGRSRRVRRLGRAILAAGVVGGLAFFLVLDRGESPTFAESPLTPAAESPAPATPEPEPAPPTTTPPTTAPSAPTPTPSGQTFVWAPSPGAAAYEFQLFRAGSRIYRVRVTEPRLELPRRWRQGGRAHVLEPGSYRWYVWPISAETQRQARVATVQARLVIDD